MSSESRVETEGNGSASVTGQTLFADPQEVLLSMQNILGRKWHPVILYYLLSEGPMGFSALKDQVSGISSKMLSESLGDLEAAGLVAREVISDRPARVEYSLTDRGESLEPLVMEMVRWGDAHADAIEAGDADEESSESSVEGTPESSVARSRRATWEGQ